MKLHLPKMLLIAVMTACSYVQAALTTPTQGTNKYTYENGGWVKDTNNSNTTDEPSRNGNTGAFMVFSSDFTPDNTTGYGDTSDGDGGVWVEDNVTVTNFSLGNYAGSVYVGSGAALTASLGSNGIIKSNGATDRSNIWVDGSFTLTGLKGFGGAADAANHYWHIGTNGKITLSDITTASGISKNGKTWNIEVVENNFRAATEEELAATLTNRSTTQTTHEFLEAGGDLSSYIDSVTIILGDGTECTASLSGTDGHHTATFNAIESTTLTWAGTADNATWTNTGSNWVDSNGAATSFLNGDSVTFGAAAEGISSTVNVGSSVTVNNMAVNGSYTLNIADSASLAVQGELNIAEEYALEVTGSGSSNGEYAVQIDELTGGGALNVTSGGEHGYYVRVDNASGYTGAISVTKGTGAAAVELRSLSGTIGVSSVTLANDAEIYFEVNSGATATYNGTITGTGALKKTAAGTLKLYSADSTADIHVNGGILYTEGSKTLGSGAIYVNSGGTLKLGDNGGDTVVFSDNQKLILNGGKVVWSAASSTIYDVDVTASSDFSIFDMEAGTNKLVIKSLDIAASTTLTINSNSDTQRWKHRLNVEALTGDGTLSVQGPVSNASAESSFNIGSLTDFTGLVNVTSNEVNGKNVYNATISTGSEAVDFKSLTFTGYGESGETSTATFNVQGNTNIETLLAAGATVNISAGKTLTIDGTDASVQNSIGTLSSAGNLTYTSSGSMSIGTLSMSGDAILTVSSGAGALNLTDSVTIAAESNATLTGSMGLGNTIVNNGTLALNGSTFELLNELATGKYTVKSEGNAGYTHGGSNGFYNANGAEYYLTYGGALAEGTSAELITVKNGDTTYNVGIDDAGQVYFGTSNAVGTTFYISDGEVTVSSSDAARALAYELSADTTMKLSEGAATNAGVTINAAGDSTINLAAGSTLNTFTKEGSGTITLTGSGTYDLGSNTSTNVSGLTAEAWTGTVTLSAIPAAAGLDVNDFGNANSKVKLDGVSGWFARGKFNPHIVLGDNGLTYTDYSTNEVYNFANGISGNGNFVVSANADTVASTPSIAIGSNSDTSLKWSGKFKVDNVYGSVTLLLNGGGTYFDAESATAGIEMNDADNTLYLYVGYATAPADNENSNNISDYDTTGAVETTINGAISNNSTGTLELTVLNNTEFNKEVAVTSMTVNSGKTATMNATLKAGNVTNNGELKLGTAATVTGGTMSNVQMSSTGIDTTATDGSNGSIDNALVQLARDASFTIEDMTLTGTTSISATEGTAKVTLSNVTATSHLKLNATAANSFVAAGGDESGSISYSYGLGLGSAEAETNSITLNLNVTDIVQPTESGLYTLTVTLSNFAGSGFDGLDVDAWKALVGFDQESWLGQALVDATFTTEAVTLAETGEAAPTVSYGYAAGDGGSNVGTLTITITGLNVPEPTTATLSLMALAALAARRRRND